ncbi:MAG TPA: hypothetical protein VII23_13285 [Terriglobales bacterium]|jgi:TolA-binding protein
MSALKMQIDADSVNAIKGFLVMREIKEYILVGTLLLLALNGCSALAQVVDPSQTPDASTSGSQRQRQAEDPWTEEQKRDMVKKRNLQRQQDIKKDTDQLLDLATQLKQYVDKTNENIISVDVIKKAEQIEKLAHAVKDKMKGM